MEKLDPYFVSYNKLDKDSEHSIFYIKAEELVNKKRIDIIVKHYYIKARETGENLELAEDMYKKHIQAFTNGTFQEQGNKEKTSIENYIEVFNKMIDDFKERGFDEELSIIPVGVDGEILDGAHRVSCALYFNKQVKVIKFPNLSVDYGFEFFRKRLLDEFYLDFIAKEYVNLKRQVYALFVWPRIGKDENIKYIEESLDKDNFNIIYKKQLKLDKRELWNLVFNIYKDEQWIRHNHNYFESVKEKRDLCYDSKGYLYVYVLSCLTVESLTQKKEMLREHFGVGKSSVHTTDTYEESAEILDIILDKDYDKILYENFLKTKKLRCGLIKWIKRKLIYIYQRTKNIKNKITGKPV